MSTTSSQLGQVQRATNHCLQLARQVVDLYVEINEQMTRYEFNIAVVKNKLITARFSEVNCPTPTSNGTKELPETTLLDQEAKALKDKVNRACSHLMGKLGEHLDAIRTEIENILCVAESEELPQADLLMLHETSHLLDEAFRYLGVAQFGDSQCMFNVFKAVDNLQSLCSKKK
ncbi:hypothetical protein IFT47_23575 [Pseudomonas sp. CFBP 13711]|uniref:hypothetical protein n=1 Tax=unclassified Pseudomonas TaxID=196821 RepID=UPI00177B4E1D|nr:MULTISPECIES: hypothetical protein [unclassified Pseudomonas]MBD8709617.1 hypothetical protein [Pseudomonas sp. CFBP 13711]MBD8714653.1 hypothetical protein [Pseudomonas sp. CFBP 13715]